MRIAIISDIHSNLEALTKTLELIKQKSVDEIVCLGDIVGYGANPNECIELVRDNTKHIILGNHEDAAATLNNINKFNIYAQTAMYWTHRVLKVQNKEFIEKLPRTLELYGLFFVHSSPYKPEEWNYLISSDEIKQNFKYFSTSICFFGHTHFPGVYNEDGERAELRKNEKFLINTGSVGQPRDLNWKLSFGIFDTELWTYENIRSEYDVNTASEKILKAGLPKYLADRILVGR